MPLVAAMVATWFGTSYFWLRITRIPRVVALAAAPAVTTTIVWVLSLIWERAGWFWSGARVLPVLAIVATSGFGLWFWLVSSHHLVTPRGDKIRWRYLPTWWGFALACAVGFLLAATPMFVSAPPDNPVQQWDPSFHMNGVWGITQLGVAAPGEGLAHNFGGAASRGYPIGWHAFTSLFATAPTTVPVSNASSLALMAVWVVATAAFVRFIYPSRIAVLASPVIAGVLPSMPADALTMYSQAPNAMSVALLPGIAAISVLAGRQTVAILEGRASHWRHLLQTLLIAFIALYGGIQAHPVVAFNLLVLLVPAALSGAAALIVWSVRHRRAATAAVVSLGVAAAVALVIFVQLTPEVESMRDYNRDGVNLMTAISQVFAPTPPFPRSVGVPLTAGVLTVLVTLGSVWIVLARNGRHAWARWQGAVRPVAWPIWSYLLFLTLTFFAYGPDWPIRTWIVGPWFNDGRRIMEPMSLPLVMLAAVGFEWLTIWVVRWWKMSFGSQSRSQQSWVAFGLGAFLFAATLGAGTDGRVAAARSVTDPSALGKPGMATQGVLDMMRELPDLLPEDAVILGDPQAGGVYVQMIGQRWAYFPQLSLLNADRESQDTLVTGFNNIGVDPRVCEVIVEQGITHFLQVPDGYYYSRLRSDRMPGLYQVDTSQGFELVAQGDDARLYRITACD